jgi:hypothetical protein
MRCQSKSTLYRRKGVEIQKEPDVKLRLPHKRSLSGSAPLRRTQHIFRTPRTIIHRTASIVDQARTGGIVGAPLLSSRACFKTSFDPCSTLGLKDIGEASSKLLTFWRSIAGYHPLQSSVTSILSDPTRFISSFNICAMLALFAYRALFNTFGEFRGYLLGKIRSDSALLFRDENSRHSHPLNHVSAYYISTKPLSRSLTVPTHMEVTPMD